MDTSMTMLQIIQSTGQSNYQSTCISSSKKIGIKYLSKNMSTMQASLPSKKQKWRNPLILSCSCSVLASRLVQL